MEFFIELILELIFEGSIELSKSNKTPKYIRYPLIVIILLFSIIVIGFIFFVGALLLKENIMAGIFIILIGLVMLVSAIVKFRKMYLVKMDKK